MQRRIGAAVALIAVGALSCNTDNPLETPNASPLQPPLVASVTEASDTLLSTADNWIRTSKRNTNYGLDDSVRIRSDVDGTDTARVVVMFEHAAIAAQIGSDSLTSATLEFTVKTAQTTTDLAVHRLKRSWTETGSTWNCGQDTIPSNTSQECAKSPWKMGGSQQQAFETTPTSVVHVTQGQTGVVRFNVTADIQAFLAGYNDNGWVLKNSSENQTMRVSFWSRQATQKPRLVLSVARTDQVPAQAPDSEPEDLYQLSRMVPVSTNSTTDIERDALSILFKANASTADRTAVISRIQGQVIGGTRITPTDGFYIIRITDPGTTDSLERILASLDTAQAVDLAPNMLRVS